MPFQGESKNLYNDLFNTCLKYIPNLTDESIGDILVELAVEHFDWE